MRLFLLSRGSAGVLTRQPAARRPIEAVTPLLKQAEKGGVPAAPPDTARAARMIGAVKIFTRASRGPNPSPELEQHLR